MNKRIITETEIGWAFVLLHDGVLSSSELSAGEIEFERVDLGLVHTIMDECGVVERIEVEPMARWGAWEEVFNLFEQFDAEGLHVPYLAKIDDDVVSSIALNGSDMIDGEQAEVSLEEHPEEPETVRRQNEKTIGFIVHSAQRLMERVIRGEPVLVGPKAPAKVSGYCGLPLRDLKPRIQRKLPRSQSATRRLLNEIRRVEHEKKAAETSVARITLEPISLADNQPALSTRHSSRAEHPFIEQPKVKWPSITLDIFLQPDGYPSRVERFYGCSTVNEASTYGIVARENGELEILGFRGKSRKFKSNLMSRKIERGTLLALWPDWHFRPQPYQVSDFQILTSSAS